MGIHFAPSLSSFTLMSRGLRYKAGFGLIHVTSGLTLFSVFQRWFTFYWDISLWLLMLQTGYVPDYTSTGVKLPPTD